MPWPFWSTWISQASPFAREMYVDFDSGTDLRSNLSKLRQKAMSMQSRNVLFSAK
jgi:hypothetical protein